MFGKTNNNKFDIYEKDWSKFYWEKFVLDYLSIDWKDLLKIDKLNLDITTQMCFEKINISLDT